MFKKQIKDNIHDLVCVAHKKIIYHIYNVQKLYKWIKKTPQTMFLFSLC